MSDRKIYCYKCKKYVGEIRDAKLMKGLAFLCPDCQENQKQKDLFGNDNNDFGKIFGDMFKSKY